VIESRGPIAFVWSGDAVYADYDAGLNFTSFPPYTGSIEATPKVLAEAYEKQLQNPAYASFLRNSNNITVFGTYDDHDYGVNNGDKTYKHAKHAAVAFLKFTGESKASPMYKRAERGYGLYGVKMFDFSRPAGQELVSDEEAAIDPDVVVSRNISSDAIYAKLLPFSFWTAELTRLHGVKRLQITKVICWASVNGNGLRLPSRTLAQR